MYKNTICRPSCIFFGVANYWGQDFHIIFTPFGVFGSQFTFTIAAIDIIACGLTLQCDFCLWTAHLADGLGLNTKISMFLFIVTP